MSNLEKATQLKRQVNRIQLMYPFDLMKQIEETRNLLAMLDIDFSKIGSQCKRCGRPTNETKYCGDCITKTRIAN